MASNQLRLMAPTVQKSNPGRRWEAIDEEGIWVGWIAEGAAARFKAKTLDGWTSEDHFSVVGALDALHRYLYR